MRNRCENRLSPNRVVFSESVSADEDTIKIRVVDCERPEAMKTFETIGTPGLVGAQDYLGIRLRSKRETFTNKLIAKFDVVIDLAVKCEAATRGFVHIRLMACSTQVDNRKTPMSKTDAGWRGSTVCQNGVVLLLLGRAIGIRKGMNTPPLLINQSKAAVIRAAMPNNAKHRPKFATIQ